MQRADIMNLARLTNLSYSFKEDETYKVLRYCDLSTRARLFTSVAWRIRSVAQCNQHQLIDQTYFHGVFLSRIELNFFPPLQLHYSILKLAARSEKVVPFATE